MKRISKDYLSRRVRVERVLAAFILVGVSPLFLILCLLVRVKMGSPVFFRQQRVGRFGKTFEIFKFRTMVTDAERLGGGYIPAELNLVPPFGQFMRSTSLDEIPQLINILLGQMSFVGPRPALPQQYARYTPEQARRVLVPQGITGLAQVTYRNDAPWSKRICKDLEYVDSVNLRMDLNLVGKTLVKVVRSEGVMNNQTAADVDDLQPATEDTK
ncbi:sugar transferase [Pseudarthrobacter defluvii]|uniref:sugar transferase n=1 Tax=Pseudarthrobacter defluvii TaxID=410837 RepID=UPI0025774C49|nr:sugar transferase [Pseudarthrobacter defluvii]WJH23703.1 sugar transferase [Pseudarthrobacter defluvii]